MNTRCKAAKGYIFLGEGRLINLAAAEGHPSEVMDMSFANQSLVAEYVWKKGSSLEKKVYGVPVEIDKQVALLKLADEGRDHRQTDAGTAEIPLVLGDGHLKKTRRPRRHS